MQPGMEHDKEVTELGRPQPLGGWSPLRVIQLVFFTALVFFGIFLGGAAQHLFFARRYEWALCTR
jgi:hypothetical protein